MPADSPTPDSPKDESTTPEQKVELSGAALVVEQTRITAVATTGKRQAFRDIRRQLQEQELSSPGVQKLLLEELETADAKCDVLEGYVERFHEADKRAAVLQEKLTTQTAFDILFGAGVGLGCAIMGLAPLFWDGSIKGPITLGVGFLLVAGTTAARIVKQ
jgi:hypothetical protein